MYEMEIKNSPLRVVDQEKTCSFYHNDIKIYRNENIIMADDGKRNYILGRYENEERALEVFLDMHKLRTWVRNGGFYYMPSK